MRISSHYGGFAGRIAERGVKLGYGASRVAYLLRDKVYKFPFKDDAQDQHGVEKYFYEIMPEKYKALFPDFQFFGRVTQSDFVEIAEDSYVSDDCYPAWVDDIADNHIDDVYDLFADNYEDDNDNSLMHSSLGAFVFYHPWSLSVPLLVDFLYWFEEQGGVPYDILENNSNYGIDEYGDFKIIDIGWSSL